MEWDQAVLDWFVEQRREGLDGVVAAFSIAMSPRFIILACVLGVAVAAVRIRRMPVRAVWVLATVCAAGLSSSLLKTTFGRARPDESYQMLIETNPSMPSGHALVAMGAAVAVACVVRRTWVPAVVVLAVGSGLSRLYLGVHWLSDVAAGWLLGAFIGFMSWLLLRRYLN